MRGGGWGRMPGARAGGLVRCLIHGILFTNTLRSLGLRAAVWFVGPSETFVVHSLCVNASVSSQLRCWNSPSNGLIKTQRISNDPELKGWLDHSTPFKSYLLNTESNLETQQIQGGLQVLLFEVNRLHHREHSHSTGSWGWLAVECRTNDDTGHRTSSFLQLPSSACLCLS